MAVYLSDLANNFPEINSNLSELSDDLSSIAGTVYNKNMDGFILPNNIWSSVASITLPAGTYILTQYTNFAAGAAGMRSVRLLQGNAVYLPSPQLLTAVNGERIQMSYCTFVKITEPSTVSFQAFQNSGASICLDNFIYKILKIV